LKKKRKNHPDAEPGRGGRGARRFSSFEEGERRAAMKGARAMQDQEKEKGLFLAGSERKERNPEKEKKDFKEEKRRTFVVGQKQQDEWALENWTKNCASSRFQKREIGEKGFE